LALTVLAGFAQLASHWLIAIRMGQHQQGTSIFDRFFAGA
jgi:hypothetical protein